MRRASFFGKNKFRCALFGTKARVTHIKKKPEDMEISHDSITRWSASAKVQPRDLWGFASKEISALPEDEKGILIFDDVAINESRSQKMEIVNWQCSGSDQCVVKGIGVLNALWQTDQDNCTPIDHRIWNPDDDKKTKNDQLQRCALIS